MRTRTPLQWLTGVGGRALPLVRVPPPGSREDRGLLPGGWGPKAALRRLMRRETGQQDKAIGIAELADALATGRPHLPSHAFTLHLTELTLAIQAAGLDGEGRRLETSFEPPDLLAPVRGAAPDYARLAGEGRLARALDRMHRH